MCLRLVNFTEDFAKEICKWKYSDEFSIYNFPKWEMVVKEKWAIADKIKRREMHGVIDNNKELCGYIRLQEKEEYILIGLGIKPEKCGQGLGYEVMDLIKECGKALCFGKKLRLEVRSFNKRAIKCYEKAGFKSVEKYNKKTLLGESEFVVMDLM